MHGGDLLSRSASPQTFELPVCLDHTVAPSFLPFPFSGHFPRAWHVPSRDAANPANQTEVSYCAIGERRDKALFRAQFLYFFPQPTYNIVRCEEKSLGLLDPRTNTPRPWRISKRLSRSSTQVGCGQRRTCSPVHRAV